MKDKKRLFPLNELSSIILRFAFIVLGIVLSILLIFLLIAFLIFGRYLSDFLKVSNLTVYEIVSIISKSDKQNVILDNSKYNILFLGTDYIANRDNKYLLTDTIMLISVNIKTGKIVLISFPRDIWINDLNMKINSLYQLDPNLTAKTIEKLANIPIHHTVAVNLEQVSSIIDLLGGVTINVPEPFIDTLYPRADIDIATENNPKHLYKTVAFEKGSQKLTGERALQYIRSRHSSGAQGNDLSRNTRQQEVFLAIINKLQQKEVWLNSKLVGGLYEFYSANWKEAIKPPELFSLVTLYLSYKPSISIVKITLTQYPEDPEGLLFHPALNSTFGQWAFFIRDQQALQDKIHQSLN